MLYENIIEYIKKHGELIIETINNPNIVVNFEKLETGFTAVHKKRTTPIIYRIIRHSRLDNFYMLKENLDKITELYNTKFNTKTNRWKTKHGKAPIIDKDMHEREESEISNLLQNKENVTNLINYYKKIIIDATQSMVYSSEPLMSFKSIRVLSDLVSDTILLPNGVVYNGIDVDDNSKLIKAVYLYISLISIIKSTLDTLKQTHTFYNINTSPNKESLYTLDNLYIHIEDIIMYLHSYINSINKLDRVQLNNIRKYVKIDEQLSKELKSNYSYVDIQNANKTNQYRNVWIKDPITELILEPNDEMIDKVYEHCKHIPSFEVLYLRKTKLTYLSDGRLETTPDAINHNVKIYRVHSLNDWFLEGSPELLTDEYVEEEIRPCIYHGEAWCLYFTAFKQDILRGCRVYFATPEQYINAYKDTRPDLLEGFVPFSDLMVVTNDWCSRNNPRLTYHKGIDLYTPWGQRQSLSSWILGPCISKETIRFDKEQVVSMNGYYVRRALLEWQKMQDSLVR